MFTDTLSLCTTLPEGPVPSEVELIPPGPDVVGRDGRRWQFYPEDAERLVAIFTGQAVLMPIDWEHATELLAPEGHEAPAAGWLKGVFVNSRGGISATVEWTPRGAAQVAAREYRYLSAAFFHDPSRHIVALSSVALTNKPNLYIKALNSRAATHTPMEVPMLIGPQQLANAAVALGLPRTASREQVAAAALNSMQQPAVLQQPMPIKPLAGVGQDTANQTALATLAAALKAQPPAAEPVVDLNQQDTAGLAALFEPVRRGLDLGNATALSQPQPQPTHPVDLNTAVPRSEYDHALNRAAQAEATLAQQRAELNSAQAQTVVDQAVAEGKIAPASKPLFLTMCSTQEGMAQFQEFIKTAPAIVTPTPSLNNAQVPGAPGGAGSLDAYELAVCSQMGVNPDEYALVKAGLPIPDKKEGA